MPRHIYIALLLLGIVAGCERQPDDKNLPALPEFALDGLTATAREPIEAAISTARAEPSAALPSATAARLLHAYAQTTPAAAWYERARALDPDNAHLAYLHARVLHSLGDRVAAISALEEVQTLEPGYPPALLLLADLQSAAGDGAAANDHYRLALDAQPELPAALLGLARLRLADDRERGMTLLRKATTAAGPYGAAHYALAQALREAGDEDGARVQLAAFERFRKQAPYLEDPWLADVRALNEARQGHLDRALRAWREGRLREAAASFEASLEKDPLNTMAHANLIAIYGQLEEYDSGTAHYETGRAQSPNFVKLHVNYGLLQLKQDRHAAAIAAFEHAIVVDPGHGKAYLSIGVASESLGDKAAALEWYRKAVENDPENRQARHTLGRALMTRGQHLEAIAVLEPASEPDDHNSIDYLRTLARAQVRSSRYDAAETSLARANRLARRFKDDRLARATQSEINQLRQARGLP